MGRCDHKPSQNKRILAYMEQHGNINPLSAWSHCGVYRLSARISDLRASGYAIKSERVTVKNQYGEDCRVASYSFGVENE